MRTPHDASSERLRERSGRSASPRARRKRPRRSPPCEAAAPSGENGADARRRRKRGPRRMPHTPQGSATESTKQMRRSRRAPPMGGGGPERRERCRCEATTEARPEAYAAYAAGQRDGVNEADAPLSPRATHGRRRPERRERCRCEATTEARPEAYAAYAAGQRDGVNEPDAPLSPRATTWEAAAPSGENGADARRRRKRGPRRMPHTPQGSATEATNQMRRYRPSGLALAQTMITSTPSA